jgi:hypothetical protein
VFALSVGSVCDAFVVQHLGYVTNAMHYVTNAMHYVMRFPDHPQRLRSVCAA